MSNLFFLTGHMCYMQKIDDSESESEEDGIHSDDENSTDDDEPDNSKSISISKEEIVQKYVFFDFETMQDREKSENQYGKIFEHVPNVCIAHIVCEDCCDEDLTECFRCGVRIKTFIGKQCLNDFCQFLFGKDMKNVIAVAHNAKGFDGQFILQFLMENEIVPKIISKGKILTFC